MASVVSYTLAEVRRKLDESDDEICHDSDTDRDSNYQVSDIEPDSEENSNVSESESERQSAADVADVASDAGDTDTGSGVLQDVASTSSRTEWIPVTDKYVSPADISFTAAAGIVQPCDLTADSQPIEFLQLFVTDNVFDLFVDETNRYAMQYINKAIKKPRSRVNQWNATDAPEMKKFIGLLLAMGIVKKPNIEDYWSTDPILSTPLFNDTISRDRFTLLLKFWHFSNNEEVKEGDRLFKLKTICDRLLERFQAVYTPGKQLSIDESMVLWRGRLMFRQYIPGKRHKYGVKLYMLCEPSGYVWNAVVYSGKSDPVSGLGHSESVVMKLMEKRLDCGHILFVDNFYTSFPLSQELLKRHTLLCGTLRRNRKHLPEAVVSAKLKTGQHIARRNGRTVVMKWKDKRDVMMLSTLHTGNMTDSSKVNRRGEHVKKPDCVIDYNQHMCGVDRIDQLMAYYTPLRKTLKWYRKVVLQFLDMAVVNAYLLYTKLGGSKRQIWFRKQIIRSLVAADDRPKELQPTTSSFMHHKASDLSRLSGQHYFDVIPATDAKSAPTRKCVVCRKRGQRKETRYLCETCPSKPALCVVPCFKDFHSSANF